MMSRLLVTVLATILATGATGVAAHEARYQSSVSAAYPFPLPEPGTYSLPPIKAAAGGTVLDETGRARNLRDVVRGRVTVLAFIYTRCGDICPVASLRVGALQDLAAREGDLKTHLRLVSMSFDPEHDTPKVMAEHAAHWRSHEASAPDWLFLTASDGASLLPILRDYDQAVRPKPDLGSQTGPLYHIFRAYLIDRSGTIRNIYSLDLLDPKLVLTDVRTLLIEEELRQRQSAFQR